MEDNKITIEYQDQKYYDISLGNSLQEFKANLKKKFHIPNVKLKRAMIFYYDEEGDLGEIQFEEDFEQNKECKEFKLEITETNVSDAQYNQEITDEVNSRIANYNQNVKAEIEKKDKELIQKTSEKLAEKIKAKNEEKEKRLKELNEATIKKMEEIKSAYFEAMKKKMEEIKNLTLKKIDEKLDTNNKEILGLIEKECNNLKDACLKKNEDIIKILEEKKKEQEEISKLINSTGKVMANVMKNKIPLNPQGGDPNGGNKQKAEKNNEERGNNPNEEQKGDNLPKPKEPENNADAEPKKKDEAPPLGNPINNSSHADKPQGLDKPNEQIDERNGNLNNEKTKSSGDNKGKGEDNIDPKIKEILDKLDEDLNWRSVDEEKRDEIIEIIKEVGVNNYDEIKEKTGDILL